MLGYAHLERNVCNVCNLMQAYCFRFYFLLVTAIILQKMVRCDATHVTREKPLTNTTPQQDVLTDLWWATSFKLVVCQFSENYPNGALHSSSCRKSCSRARRLHSVLDCSSCTPRSPGSHRSKSTYVTPHEVFFIMINATEHQRSMLRRRSLD